MTEQPSQHATPALRGVNLGGWLVLEKWMTPSLFRGLKATDEYGLCSSPNAVIKSMLKTHRDTFITAADFRWLKSNGIKTVRLPVGYWIFGDEDPYYGAIEYVDKAFGWARAYDIRILLDLHGAPGSQNGTAHSGREGACTWQAKPENIIKTLSVVQKLAERYKGRAELLGIELLNEPKSSIPRRVLLKYYEAAYRIIRDKCGPDVWVVFHDSFKPQLRGRGYQNVFIDTHQYQAYSKRDKRLDISGHMAKTMTKVPGLLSKMARYHSVIVGEWSLALDSRSLRGLEPWEHESAYRAYAAAQLLAYDRTKAWFFWSYKTEGGGAWSYRDCVEKGLLPGGSGSAAVPTKNSGATR
jgi:glucan 1,3-beta-glucosidase